MADQHTATGDGNCAAQMRNQLTLCGLGLAPRGTFSGFEKSFFKAIGEQGFDITPREVDVPWFKWLVTALTVRPSKKSWGLARDRAYHTSINGYRVKSRKASRIVSQYANDNDFVYQIGSLWNPLLETDRLPLFLQLDYTSRLSEQRGSEWRRRPGKEARFWIGEETKLYQQSARIFTTTDNARRSIVEDYGIDEKKVVVVRCGVDPFFENVDCSISPPYDQQKILFVGKGHRGKGLDTLLEAFAIVRDRFKKATLTVVGPTGFSTTQTGVEYLGRVQGIERIRNLYLSHSMFVMPSRFEPLGQVFLEAMACQLPCIGTTLDAMPELIDDGVTGFTINPGDVGQLAERISTLLSDSVLAAKMGGMARHKLENEYTWAISSQRLSLSLREAFSFQSAPVA